MAVITLNGLLDPGEKSSPIALSPNLSDMGPVDHSPPLPPAAALRAPGTTTLVDNLPISEIGAALTLYRMRTFFQDYYYRIHIKPVQIDLGVVAAAQSRVISVWNAYPDQEATLGAITSDQPGVEYTGAEPPYVFQELQQVTWDLVVTTAGPPEIDAHVLWDFTDVPDPAPVVVTGTRAIQFKYPPEVPVNEDWGWLTNVITAVDGTEQRAGLRGVPRMDMDLKVVLTDDSEIRDVQQMLFSAQNRLWLPWTQYATPVTVQANASTDILVLDTVLADVRVDEYLMLALGGTSTLLVQVAELVAGGVRLAAPLAVTVPAGTVAAPGAPSFVADTTTLRRYAVHDAAEISLRAQSSQTRTQWARPGNTIVLATFDGHTLLDKRPLANSLVPEAYVANTMRYDGEVGAVDIVTLWDYTKIAQQFEFLVQRVQDPEQMDYWKVFGDTMRGSLKNFLMPTWRPDLELLAPMGLAANSATFKGPQYADFFYKATTHRRLVFTTAGGVHYAKVTSAVKTAEGDSLVVFSPALPNDVAYTQTEMVSLLLSQRIDNDVIRLQHMPRETTLSFNTRTADP
jgi:hypothetical protein